MSRVVILGGGIAGLTAAYRLGQAEAATGVRAVLVEAAPRLGGKIVTARDGGFVLEGGPDAFIPQKPQALGLVRELGLEGRLLASNDRQRGTFIFHRGRLVPVPEGLQSLVPRRWGPFLRSPLLTWPAKLRYALEGLVPPKRDPGDESIAGFVRRRFGRGALASLAEPILAHLHAGDVERLSLAATYPRLRALEQRYGSLRRGVRAGVAAGDPRPLFWTLRHGLGELVETLASRLEPSSLLLGRRATSLRRSLREPGAFTVALDDGRKLEAAAVVLAVPAAAAAQLALGLDVKLAGRLRELSSVSMATLSLAYRRRDVAPPPAGFGFFVPRREGRVILAGSWTCAKFAHRVPGEHHLLRLFLGGALQEEILELDDKTLIRRVEDDLGQMIGLRAQPVLRRLFRWPQGYPQYRVGHRERVRAIEEALPPGLLVAGSAYHGVGLPDCIRSGGAAAEGVRKHLNAPAPHAGTVADAAGGPGGAVSSPSIAKCAVSTAGPSASRSRRR